MEKECSMCKRSVYESAEQRQKESSRVHIQNTLQRTGIFFKYWKCLKRWYRKEIYCCQLSGQPQISQRWATIQANTWNHDWVSYVTDNVSFNLNWISCQQTMETLVLSSAEHDEMLYQDASSRGNGTQVCWMNASDTYRRILHGKFFGMCSGNVYFPFC
jgi:hypothetical protein